MVDLSDSKSDAARRAGSSPALGTILFIRSNLMKKFFNDFATQIQSDEIGAKDGSDWFNDFEQRETDDHDSDIIND